MAAQDGVKKITLEAGQDLSSNQFYFVALASDGQIDPAGDGAAADGILYNDPDAAGKAAEVAIPNGARVKVVSGGSVSVGDDVASDANGKATTATTGDVILGKAVEAGATDGDVISILFNVRGVVA